MYIPWIQNGHNFQIHGQEHNFKGTIICVVGDTPALALVGGFKSGVGFADRKCRHCMANNDQIQKNVSDVLTVHLSVDKLTLIYVIHYVHLIMISSLKKSSH